MIEKLTIIPVVDSNGNLCGTRLANNEEIINKLNEIIDYINHSDKVSLERISKELSNVAKIKGGM